VLVTGVYGVGQVGGVQIWGYIDTSQTAGWAPVSSSQGGSWSPVSSSQGGSWSPVLT
jgi:hypothetical protein